VLSLWSVLLTIERNRASVDNKTSVAHAAGSQ
jgi:hypothetical protein